MNGRLEFFGEPVDEFAQVIFFVRLLEDRLTNRFDVGAILLRSQWLLGTCR